MFEKRLHVFPVAEVEKQRVGGVGPMSAIKAAYISSWGRMPSWGWSLSDTVTPRRCTSAISAPGSGMRLRSHV